jgi:hypothetical protein
MLYTSSGSAADGLDTDDPLQVPLAFWKHRRIGYEPPEMVGADDIEIIDVRWRVNAGDYEGVKHLYPWDGLHEVGKELGGQRERERQRLGGRSLNLPPAEHEECGCAELIDASIYRK